MPGRALPDGGILKAAQVNSRLQKSTIATNSRLQKSTIATIRRCGGLRRADRRLVDPKPVSVRDRFGSGDDQAR